MPSSQYTGAPLPGYSDTNDLAAAFDAYSDVVEPHYVLFADSVAERDTLYGGAPEDTIVSVSEDKALYQKLASGWHTLSIDTGWITSGFVLGTDFTAGTAVPKIRNRNGTIELRGTVVYNGAGIACNTSGNIVGDPICLTIPSAYWPPEILPFVGQFGGVEATCYLDSAGRVRIGSGNPSVNFGAGSSLIISHTWILG